MGLFEKLFKGSSQRKEVDTYFKMLNGYSPVFHNFSGGIYEMELTRASIHAFANLCSKLKPEVIGSAYKSLEATLQFRSHPFMDTTKFLYRLATILSVDTTAFILPLYGEDGRSIVGYYPLLPMYTEIMEVSGNPWLRYTFADGKKASIPFEEIGVLTKYQYDNDLFGGKNKPLMPTLQLLNIQKQGMEEGIKQSAMIRFMAKLSSTLRPEDMAKERERFSKDNLSADNKSGVMMFDAKYSDIKQIDSKPFVIDAEQMKLIQTNVFNYFGVNENILQNKYSEDEFNAFYEGMIEPFALQLSMVLTNMTFTRREISHGNHIMLSSNRLQYASNKTKLQVSSQMFDRGVLTTNQVMDIWNLPRVKDGDDRFIRREYVKVTDLDKDRKDGGWDAIEDEGEGISVDSDSSDDTESGGREEV